MIDDHVKIYLPSLETNPMFYIATSRICISQLELINATHVIKVSSLIITR